MKTIIGKITIDILTSIYQPFWFAILLSIMTMFFLFVCKNVQKEQARDGKQLSGHGSIILKETENFVKNIYCFSIITCII